MRDKHLSTFSAYPLKHTSPLPAGTHLYRGQHQCASFTFPPQNFYTLRDYLVFEELRVKGSICKPFVFVTNFIGYFTLVILHLVMPYALRSHHFKLTLSEKISTASESKNENCFKRNCSTIGKSTPRKLLDSMSKSELQGCVIRLCCEVKRLQKASETLVSKSKAYKY